MLKATLIFGALAALLATVPPALAADMGQTKTPTPSVDTAKTEKMAAPEGFVVVQDFVIVDLKQLPVDLLQNADGDFSSKNLGESSADIRAAARVFRLEAKQAKGDNDHLKKAADELDKLASDVKNEVVKTGDAFRMSVARALYHSAAHHRIQAQMAFNDKMFRQAGEDLRASAVAAELASRFAGKELLTSNQTMIDRARTVASELEKNEGWTPDDVTGAISNLQSVVDRIASRVMPSQKAKAGETPTEL